MDIYAQNILDHYHHPRQRGFLPPPRQRVQAVNATCGDRLSFDVAFLGNKVKEIRWRGEGCAISMASASLLSLALVGRSKKEILSLAFKDMQELLGIEISERRSACALLSLQAVSKACRKI
jgi:nitrogen fixation NifU-like protein